METKQKRSFTSFTVVELMIVLVILGLLAALIIPSFRKAEQHAKMTEKENAYKTILLDSPQIVKIVEDYPDKSISDVVQLLDEYQKWVHGKGLHMHQTNANNLNAFQKGKPPQEERPKEWEFEHRIIMLYFNIVADPNRF